MYYTSQKRYNPETGEDQYYYRLKESYRDTTGLARNRVIMNIGFMTGLSHEEIRDVLIGLNYRKDHRDEASLWGDECASFSEASRQWIDTLWQKMVDTNVIDVPRVQLDEGVRKARKMIYTDTLQHTDARDIGAEWLCLQAVRQLQLEEFLLAQGWSEEKVKIAVAHLITRTIYARSELRSIDIMWENSGICELLKLEEEKINVHTVYKVAPDFYAIKDKLESYLCHKADSLFHPTDKIMLFDLTNFYFEGRKDASRKAKFGRSKEKRSDCKLLVLALCINTQGFIRYSSVLEGNTADPKSLPDMIERLILENPANDREDRKTLVVIDAGIASEDNLALIKEKGYNYLCVSRSRMADYELEPGAKTVKVLDTTKKQEISLTEVKHEEGGDYFLEVKSPGKQLKEESMNRRFRQRFEEGLASINASTQKKHGVKQYEKVIKRIGALEAKYPSIRRFYSITVSRNANKEVTEVKWTLEVPDEMQFGTYFLRTNRDQMDEATTWDYYNLIRDIECTNRQLKTDLNLRPIYHKLDRNADAHLFLGLLAYWIVNTIRFQLGQKGIKCYWTEIVRRMSTQKVVSSIAYNPLGEEVEMRICSDPTIRAAEIYDALAFRRTPFRRIKICGTQT